LVFTLLAVALSLACTSAKGVEIVAHRGASHDAPENTLAAFRLGFEQKADAVELDVFLTRDGQIVAMHDRTTERTTGVARPVSEQTLDELRKLDAGSWKGAAWAGERIPTLAESVAIIPDGKRMLIEIKCGAEILPELARVLAACGKKPEQLAIIGFNYATMAEAKKLLPRHEVYWVVDHKPAKEGDPPPALADLAEKALAANLDGLDLNYRFPLDAASVQQLKRQNLKVLVWTVDKPEAAARLIAAGVDAITTNRPQWLRESLASE
jgi:glycerophosphoryl diester phosphodiesterase